MAGVGGSSWSNGWRICCINPGRNGVLYKVGDILGNGSEDGLKVFLGDHINCPLGTCFLGNKIEFSFIHSTHI